MTNLFKSTAPIRNRPWIGYALAVLLPLLAWAGIVPLGDMARHFPFIVFLPGIIVATFLGGARAGVLAAVLTMLIVDYALIEPIGTVWPISTVGLWSFAFYSVAIALNIAVIDGMIRAYARLTETDRALQGANTELGVERQRLRAVIDQAPIGVSIARRDGTSELNDYARELLGHGLRTDDDSRYSSYGAVHPDGRAYAVEDYPTMRALHLGERVEAEDMLYRVGGRDGDSDDALRLFEVSSSPIMDGDTITGAVTILVDATQDREDRSALQASEALARDYLAERQFIIQLTAEQRAQTDPDAVLRLSSEALGKRLGTSRTGFYRLANQTTVNYAPGWTDGRLPPLTGSHPTDQFGARVEQQRRSGETLVFSDSRDDAIGGLDEFASAGVLSGICLSIFANGAWRGGFFVHQASVRAWSEAEVALAREVAELTWLAVERAEAMIRMAGRIDQQDATIGRVAGELREQTDGRTAAESQVRQLQKMEAVGQLTGGIAHDFNNMLAVVIGGLNLMERRLARGETDVAKYLSAAMEGATRAAALTQRLLAFARQAPLAPEAVDANRMMAGLTDLLTRTLGERVQLETVLSAGLWKINVDPNQLENVVVNLAVNARDAMPEGGRLTIETNNAHVDADYAAEYEIDAGQYVLICVSDTGTGMTRDVLAKAFDPFFTTKGVGKGTGLGLSQAFGFVRQSGGHLKVYSEVGHGTTFKIYLPRFYGDAAVAAPRRAVMPTRGGTPAEIVMVVEDEQRVRDFSVEALRELGYTVIHASSGAEALAMIEAGQDVTLLFTDIVMPEMTGRQLADRVATLLPQAKVVYTTGYTRNAVVHNGVIDPGTNFLPKPFSLDQLAGMIRRVLDGEGK